MERDKCWLNRIWAKWLPQIGITGWVTMAGVVFGAAQYAAQHYVQDAIANSPEISSLQDQTKDLPAIRQQMQDIHEEVHEIYKVTVQHVR